MFTTTVFWEQGVPPPPPLPPEANKETDVVPQNVAVPQVVQFVL